MQLRHVVLRLKAEKLSDLSVIKSLPGNKFFSESVQLVTVLGKDLTGPAETFVKNLLNLFVNPACRGVRLVLVLGDLPAQEERLALI